MTRTSNPPQDFTHPNQFGCNGCDAIKPKLNAHGYCRDCVQEQIAANPARTPEQLKDAILAKGREIDRAFGSDLEIKLLIIHAPAMRTMLKSLRAQLAEICGDHGDYSELDALIARVEVR